MNRERVTGICLQWAGKLNQAWGELSGDARRVSVGRREQLIGEIWQASAVEEEAAARQLRDFQHHNRNWHF
jgi:uncharacterized protein YjbJ (UPF0337 family)